jgi:hypothetical protein
MGVDAVIVRSRRLWHELLGGRVDQPPALDVVEVEEHVASRLYGLRTGSVERRDPAARTRSDAGQDQYSGAARLREERPAMPSSDHGRISVPRAGR